jgi:hypothetical protein
MKQNKRQVQAHLTETNFNVDAPVAVSLGEGAHSTNYSLRETGLIPCGLQIHYCYSQQLRSHSVE